MWERKRKKGVEGKGENSEKGRKQNEYRKVTSNLI